MPLFYKNRVRKTHPTLFLLSDAQRRNDGTIALDIRLFEIVEQASSLTDHHKQTSAGMMVFGVDFEVLGELLNSAGEQRYLHFGRARVALFASVLCDDFLF